MSKLNIGSLNKFVGGTIVFSLLSISIIVKAQAIEETKGLQKRGLNFTLSSKFFSGINDVKDLIKEEIVITDKLAIHYNENAKYFIRHKMGKASNPNSRHLVFIIPGFGAMSDNGYTTFMMGLLSRKGFSVISVDSPPSRRSVRETSLLGIPGTQKLDGEDLYREIKTLKAHFAARGNIFNKVSVIGASLGGLNAAQVFLVSEDANEKYVKSGYITNDLKFSRVISINPPVSNVYGLSMLDHLITNAFAMKPMKDKNGDTTTLAWLKAAGDAVQDLGTGAGASFKLENLGIIVNDFVKKEAFSPDQEKFLVGAVFSQVVKGAVVGYSQRAVGGFLEASYNPIRTFYQIFNQITMPKLQEAAKNQMTDPERYPMDVNRDIFFPNDVQASLVLPLGDKINFQIENYNQKFLAAIRPTEPQSKYLTKLDDILIESSSIIYNADKLQKPNYVLITFEDDFLLRKDDPQWITEKFDGKYPHAHSKIFQEGGHLGGYFNLDFQSYLINQLEGS